MKYRYVIALNRMLLIEDGVYKGRKYDFKHSKLTVSEDEVVKVMDFVRKYPKIKIKENSLYTCGFSKN